jgi:hypothetical protein
MESSNGDCNITAVGLDDPQSGGSELQVDLLDSPSEAGEWKGDESSSRYLAGGGGKSRSDELPSAFCRYSPYDFTEAALRRPCVSDRDFGGV